MIVIHHPDILCHSLNGVRNWLKLPVHGPSGADQVRLRQEGSLAKGHLGNQHHGEPLGDGDLAEKSGNLEYDPSKKKE